jgi:hypothetical protein
VGVRELSRNERGHSLAPPSHSFPLQALVPQFLIESSSVRQADKLIVFSKARALERFHDYCVRSGLSEEGLFLVKRPV